MTLKPLHFTISHLKHISFPNIKGFRYEWTPQIPLKTHFPPEWLLIPDLYNVYILMLVTTCIHLSQSLTTLLSGYNCVENKGA